MSEVKTRITDGEAFMAQKATLNRGSFNVGWHAALANVIMPEVMSDRVIEESVWEAIKSVYGTGDGRAVRSNWTHILDAIVVSLSGKIVAQEPVPSAGGLTREKILDILEDGVSAPLDHGEIADLILAEHMAQLAAKPAGIEIGQEVQYRFLSGGGWSDGIICVHSAGRIYDIDIEVRPQPRKLTPQEQRLAVYDLLITMEDRAPTEEQKAQLEAICFAAGISTERSEG